jgi:hypothetical protein
MTEAGISNQIFIYYREVEMKAYPFLTPWLCLLLAGINLPCTSLTWLPGWSLRLWWYF